jgi:hypothetical protein
MNTAAIHSIIEMMRENLLPFRADEEDGGVEAPPGFEIGAAGVSTTSAYSHSIVLGGLLEMS